MDKNQIYRWLSSPTPKDPPAQSQQSNHNMFHFYNDEVMSHLHGYMLLVGTLALQERTVFLQSFLPYAIIAAAATYFEYLPANPRVPAIVAVATLATCAAAGALQVSNDAVWIGGICAVNIAWGLWGPWNNSLGEE